MNKLRATLATLALAGGLVVSGSALAAPAHADSFGNKVYISSGSKGNVRVYGDVRYQVIQNGRLEYVVRKGYVWIAPGQNTWSTGRMIDAKTFVAPLRCTTFRKNGSKFTVLKAGATHSVSQTFLVHTTLLVQC